MMAGYARLSNDFWQDEDVSMLRRQNPAAALLFVLAISWCSDHSSDGRISRKTLLYILNASDEDVETLAESGLIVADEAGSVYTLRSYLKYQNSAEDIKAKAEANRERVRRWREARKTEGNGVETDNQEPGNDDVMHYERSGNGVETDNQEPRTNNQKNFIYNPQTPSGGFEDYPQPFEQFWAACAWQADKPEAYAAWKRAIRETNNATLIAAMSNYAADESNAGYWQKPARWLNNQGWLNKPKPRKPRKPTKADRELDSWRQQFAELYPGWPLPRSRADPLPGNAGYAQQHPGLPPYVQGKSLEECRRLAAQGGESS
jgi:hypothetical protein